MLKYIISNLDDVYAYVNVNLVLSPTTYNKIQYHDLQTNTFYTMSEVMEIAEDDDNDLYLNYNLDIGYLRRDENEILTFITRFKYMKEE